ncbi:MAG: hypothetical protein JWO94_164, partial [Verrucomicrobiaceae bacterium]|nr:hypothetical protein [Verrucomicrobiaceae bacterium]
MPEISELSPGIFTTIAGVFRQNRLPCLLLNLLVALLVSSYYLLPSVADVWASVAEFKIRWSYVFSGVSGGISAAILPFMVQRAMGTLPMQTGAKRLACLTLFWCYRGVEVDLFYKFQDWFFGNGHDFRTLALKVIMDQFVYSVVWAAPSYVILLRWLEMKGSWSRTLASLDRRFWLHTYPAVMVTNWLVWIPTVTLVYSLPLPLQFP